MINNDLQLSELDIKFITSQLGRIPTEIEISFIELILTNELESRAYLQILSRLNDGARRSVNNKIALNDKFNLVVNNGYKIIDKNNSSYFNRDEAAYFNNINNLNPLLDDIIINSVTYQNAEQFLKKEKTSRKNSYTLSSKFIHNEKDQIIFSTSLGLEDHDKNNITTKSDNTLIYRINFGKRSVKKHILQLSKFIDEIKNEAWFILAKSVNWNGLGVALVDLIRDYNFGINVTKDIPQTSFISHFSDDNSLAVLIIVQREGVTQFNTYCKKYDAINEEVGRVTQEPTLQLAHQGNTYINLPVTTLELQYNVNTKHFEKSKPEIISAKTIKKVRKNTSSSDQILTLLTAIGKDDCLMNSNKLIASNSSYGLYFDIDQIDKRIVFTHAEKNYLIGTSPRLSGRISIANVIRRITCTGAKPKAVIIQNLLPEISNSTLWRASELFQGQEEAVRELEVEIGNRSIDVYKDFWYQNISAIGIHKQKSVKMDISFKHDGDFISLLGSHRGELTGSAYEQYISNDKSDVLPTVDLQMEKRLQDVVSQGISTKLIKSAVNVSAGGISIAITKSLIAGEGGLGARIHLSRKLKEEELLFGETQGLVIVTLSEEDIMEFERICMTIGVPSTTIGRVTCTDRFTFNDAINVKVDTLRSIVNK